MTDGDHSSQEDGARDSPIADADTEAADSRIGTIVDKYRIICLRGRGGMGSVYEAQHTVLGRRFAIKLMLPEYATNRDTLRRFENEAKAAGQLEHPNIAAVTDLGRASDGSPYLVMEYLIGQDCSQLLAGVGPLQHYWLPLRCRPQVSAAEQRTERKAGFGEPLRFSQSPSFSGLRAQTACLPGGLDAT